MAFPSRMIGDYEFSGAVNLAGTVSLPSACVTNTAVLTGANLAESKLQHRVHATSIQDCTSLTVSQTKIVYHAYKAATVLAGYAVFDTAIVGTSSGKSCEINVRKSTAAGSTWGTILSAVLHKHGTAAVDGTAMAARTAYALSLSGTPTLAAGDKLQTTVTVAGSTGVHAKGLLIDVVLAENGA